MPYKRKRFFKRLLITATATLALLIIFESTLRLHFPQDERVEFLKESTGLKDDTLGHVNRPGSRTSVRTPEFSVEYSINERGMRDDSLYSGTKTPGLTTILIVGDSFTFGVGNAYNNIWPVIFEKVLAEKGYDVEVINAGVPAYDTRKEFLLLERLVPEYKPDIVILTFLPNDLFTNQPIKPESAEKLDEAIVNRDEKKSSLNMITLYKRILISYDSLYTSLYLMTPRAEFFKSPPSDLLNKKIKITEDLLLRAANFCRKNNAQFAVLSIPQQFQVLYDAGKKSEKIDTKLIDRRFSEFANENGFAWIETLPVLTEDYINSGEELYYRLDGHLNAKGNRIVGDFAAEKFVETLSEYYNKPPDH